MHSSILMRAVADHSNPFTQVLFETGPKLLIISSLNTCTQIMQCCGASAILHYILTNRIENERKRAISNESTPTSEVMFHLQSLNQKNPINSPSGLVALVISLILSIIPSSLLHTLIIDPLLFNSVSFSWLSYLVHVSLLFSSSLISSAFVFALLQFVDDASVVVKEFRASNPSMYQLSTTQWPSKSRSPSFTRPLWSYTIEFAICLSLFVALNLVAQQHINYFHHALEASPLLFILLPFLPIIWPIFRFGVLGTSSATLFSYVSASIAITEGKGPYGWVAQFLDSQYRYAWTLILFYWVHVLVFLSSIVAASAMNQVFEIENSLQDIIRDRTSILREQVEKSIRLSQVKSDFLSSLSHEIRTPLNGIIGMVDLLRICKGSISEEKDLVESIYSSSVHLETVVTQILDFSKLESGTLTLRTAPTSLSTIIERSVALGRLQKLTDVSINYSIDSSIPPTLVIDGTKLTQILINLISNAFKFTVRGNIQVNAKLSFDELVENGTSDQSIKLLFSVSDTGIGIPDSKTHLLFQSFSQLNTSSTREYGGTGLGLAISKQLVKLMKGEIWVESKVDEGSCFHFTIVCSAASSGTSTPTLASLPPTMRALSTPIEPVEDPVENEIKDVQSDILILVVEDNAVNQKLILRMLKKLRFNSVICAINGQEAVNSVYGHSNQPFQIILMDIHMPIMDGIEATRLIRQFPQYDTIPIIAVTADAMGPELHAHGFDDYLAKPYTLKQIAAVMEKWSKLEK
jgi:signal transduction histidine kinase/CheY-like chemotaxis protein